MKQEIEKAVNSVLGEDQKYQAQEQVNAIQTILALLRQADDPKAAWDVINRLICEDGLSPEVAHIFIGAMDSAVMILKQILVQQHNDLVYLLKGIDPKPRGGKKFRMQRDALDKVVFSTHFDSMRD
jgi:hypothetical protein